MAIVGTNPGSWAGWDSPGTGFGFGSQYTMPSPGGLITNLHAFFDTIGGSGAQGWLCIWSDATGALLVNVGIGIISNGTAVAGGQQWWTSAVTPGVFIPGGTSIWIGGYCNQGTVFSSGVGGSSQIKSMGTSGPGSFSGHISSGIGTAGAYADYTPGNLHLMRSSAWTTGDSGIMRVGSFGSGATGWVMRGGVWVQGA
jgi:hypothetical protein